MNPVSQPSTVQARIARLFVYPVKSCAGVELDEALLTETGLDLDRAWMVVDRDGVFVTQRELPRMALVKVQLKSREVVLRAPGMLALHLQIDTVEGPARVRVWNDEVPAWDMGQVAAQWFSDFLGRELRLVRFEPEHRRLSSMLWTGGVEALNQFSDGFPLLVASESSLAQLNERLAAAGHAPVGMERFRPNIVLSGLQAHDEDDLRQLTVATDEPVQLELVKPCSRCNIPDVDPATGDTGTAVTEVLNTYRRSQLLPGTVTFAMNAIVRAGEGQRLRVAQTVAGEWNFG